MKTDEQIIEFTNAASAKTIQMLMMHWFAREYVSTDKYGKDTIRRPPKHRIDYFWP
jgi:hypothetical protein